MPSGYRSVWGSEGLGGVSGVVSSLPVGFTLGEERLEGGILYKLVFNAGNSQILPGNGASPQILNGGAYSVSVSSTSQAYANMGGVVCHHATATTGTFFWGVQRGFLPSGVISDGATMITGVAFYWGANGAFQKLTANSVLVSANVIVGYCVNGAGTQSIGIRNNNCFVNFS